MKIKVVSARTPNQKTYCKKIKENDIILCHGPAGTGKTHISVGMAISQLTKKIKRSREQEAEFKQDPDGYEGEKNISKIVLTRPIVGVGKDIGYLPGGLDEKIGPYLVPFYDEALYFLENSEFNRYQQDGTIEICPITMMRGRSFHDAFVLVDEAQNCTKEELKTILTRIGHNCKLILSGDLNQSDLEREHKIRIDKGTGGWSDAILKLPFTVCIDRLFEIEGVGVCTLTQDDVQRNPIIIDIERELCDW